MKKLLFLITLSGTMMLFACGGSDEAADEKQDSIEAAAKADSMLQAELNADSTSLSVDSAAMDSLSTPAQ